VAINLLTPTIARYGANDIEISNSHYFAPGETPVGWLPEGELVQVFDNGQLLAQIDPRKFGEDNNYQYIAAPQIWTPGHHALKLRGTDGAGNFTAFSDTLSYDIQLTFQVKSLTLPDVDLTVPTTGYPPIGWGAYVTHSLDIHSLTDKAVRFASLKFDKPLFTVKMPSGEKGFVDVVTYENVEPGQGPTTLNLFGDATPDTAAKPIHFVIGDVPAGHISVKTLQVMDGNGQLVTLTKADLDAAGVDTGFDLAYAATVPHTFQGGQYVATLIDAPAGDNTVLYSGKRADYQISPVDGGVRVTGPVGVDTLKNVQHLRFSDTARNLAVATHAASIPEGVLKGLTELYIAFMNRVPDASGLDYWIGQYKAGASLQQIGSAIYGIASSPQFSAVTGYSADTTANQFVKQIYANVLGRPDPDAEGLTFWSEQLAGGVSRADMVQTLLAAAHNLKGNASVGWVADLLDNKVTVGTHAAVTLGVDYLDASDAVIKGKQIAAAVTPTSTEAAIKLIGAAEAPPPAHI
jgi:hypothetical protein